ncbi:MAG: hypothetical protein DRQ97_07235 [Gammaproteobacteria bacterium]|nr:MAG: hypothetical protein DRQ97_07235 [Gammaproteobacteria bacterium]
MVIAELAYLAIFNLAFQLPATQSLINYVKPDKFHVSWENAWTWYPFRVHATGISANGQSRSQQWQFDASSASASTSILALILKRVWISDVAVTDVNYRQRPLLRADRDYTDSIAFFPDIEGREIAPAVTTPRKDKRPWRLAIDNINVSGHHSYWIMQFSGKAAGDFSADLTFETRGGPFSLSNSQFDVKLDTMYIYGNNEVFKQGVVKGLLEFAPFVPKDNKSISLLKYLMLDADISINVNSLAFINLFTRNFNQMTIDGSGQLDGHVALERGQVLSGTDLSVDADNLMVNILGHNIQGSGNVDLVAGPEQSRLLNLAVQYKDLEVTHIGDENPLLTGENLELKMTGSDSLFETPDTLDEHRNLSFFIQGLAAPDLALFGHYLPEKWPLALYGGTGNLHGMVSLSANAVDINISISSQKADIGIRQYRFDSNLDAALKLKNTSVSTSITSVAGSYIKLNGAHLLVDGRRGTTPWNTSFIINAGGFSVLDEDEKLSEENLTDILQLAGNSDGKELLGNLHGFMEFESSASSLEWLGVLFNNSYLTSIAGRGELNGVIKLESGRAAVGTDIEVLSNSLEIDILDYRSTGKGKITMRVDEGDPGPDWFMEVVLREADLIRQNEADAYIENVNLNIQATVKNMYLEKAEREPLFAFKIQSANVTDMSIFSSYLPPDSPFQFTNGSASLSADILLQREDANGWVRLESTGLEMRTADQSARGDLTANIKLVGGVPAQMMFDISGSELRLDNVQVIGEQEQFDADSWSARFLLVHGKATWKKPLRLDVDAEINIADSRPVVAMFGNEGKRPQWLLNMLTIEDIRGTARVTIANEQVVIPFAHVVSDIMEVGAKGRISETRRDGVIYARYKKLDAVVKITDGKKNTDIIRAREKYEAYQPAALSHQD